MRAMPQRIDSSRADFVISAKDAIDIGAGVKTHFLSVTQLIARSITVAPMSRFGAVQELFDIPVMEMKIPSLPTTGQGSGDLPYRKQGRWRGYQEQDRDF